MGMAASQARYLELTARKTNTEYEGQQINQQRTALANESAGLFAQLMGLIVPTAPSSADYTTTQYTFSDGDQDYTVTDIKALPGNPDYNKTVSYYYTTSEYTGISKTRSDLGARYVTTTVPPSSNWWLTDGNSGGAATNKTRLTQCTGTEEEISAVSKIVDDAACSPNFITDFNNDPTNLSNIYYYKDANGTIRYYSELDLNAMPTDGSASSLTGSYATTLDKKVYQTSDAYVSTAESGRYSEILLEGYSEAFDMSSKTTTDTNAYNDAMNEYEFQQQNYQKQVNDINAKTSIIQAEDQSLELKLAQLDTEQQALSTEMDSVKKVIEKNIEQTFKTFS